MNHDRIHAREPQQDPERWSTGRIESLHDEGNHCTVTVDTGDRSVDLLVTQAVRELFVSRLPIAGDESPIGQRVWFRQHGGN